MIIVKTAVIIMMNIMTVSMVTFVVKMSLFTGTALVTSKDIMVEGILEGITMVAITLVDTMAVIMAPAISAVPMEVTKEVTTEVIMVDITEGIMVITMGSERLVP